jgi:glc operon protein GlcG
MKHLLSIAIAVAFLVAASLPTRVEAQAPSYGPIVTLEQARKAVASARAEAEKNKWNVAIAVVDTHGFLVALEKIDDTQTASIQIAIDKAMSSAMYRRPTKAFADALASGPGGVRVLNLRGASAIEGGLPIVVGGKVVGAIGVSGVTAEQDGMVAKAGADALK